MSKPKAIVFDMDGVLRIDKMRTPYADQIVSFLEDLDIPAMIITNECRYTVPKIREDLTAMGIDVPDEWKIHTSALALRDFLDKQFRKKSNFDIQIGIVGEKGLEEAINDLKVLYPDRAEIVETPTLNPRTIYYLVLGTVVNLQVTHLEKVLNWVRFGAHVIVSSPDIVDPAFKEDFSIAMPRHLLHMVRLNENTSEYFSVGKPNAWMVREIKKQFPELDLSEILFVGDTIFTDIKMAEEHEMMSALVLTGNATLEEVEKSIIQPDLVFKDLSYLMEWLKKFK